MTVSHSPLEGWTGQAGEVRIAEIPFLTQLNLRVEPGGPGAVAAVAAGKALGGDLPAEPCTAVLDLPGPPAAVLDLPGPPAAVLDLPGPPAAALDLPGPPAAVLDLPGPPAAALDLPGPPAVARTGDVDVLWLGPDEWLVLAEPGRQRDLEDLLRTAIGDEHGAVTDVSAQRTALSVSGPAAREVLARGCAIDLDPRYAPAGTCVQTLLARTGVTIVVRDERAGEFLLLVRASFAEYLAAWLDDACTDL